MTDSTGSLFLLKNQRLVETMGALCSLLNGVIGCPSTFWGKYGLTNSPSSWVTSPCVTITDVLVKLTVTPTHVNFDPTNVYTNSHYRQLCNGFLNQ